MVLRTYQRIVEVRDEIRMDDSGLAIGDRTFKRCYQLAQSEARRLRGSPNLTERASTIEPAFRYISDKLWHRYLFPFGTFMYRMPANPGKMESNWKKYMLDTPRDCNLLMNPYSVTAADILYLCNTGGYMDRFIYMIGIIMWAKRNGLNLLHHVRPKHNDPSACHKQNKLDHFYTLEKHPGLLPLRTTRIQFFVGGQ